MIKPTEAELNLINSINHNCIDKLQYYVNELLKENQKHNLIGKNTTQSIWSRHVLDSIQLAKYIDKTDGDIVDLGSGSGFPAIILGIVLNKKIIMVEKSPVKGDFLNKICKDLSLQYEIVNETINNKNITNYIKNNSIITSRAFKSVDEILVLLQNNLKKINKIILLKGSKCQQELQECKEKNNNLLKQFEPQIYPSILNEGFVLLLKHISN